MLKNKDALMIFNRPSAHSGLDSKIMFFIGVISLTVGKIVPVPCKNNGNEKEYWEQFS